jgi:hypothetical protein
MTGPQTRPAPPKLGHWQDVAQKWELFGPPLRPGLADTAIYQQFVDACHVVRPVQEALILGVTPELCLLDWPTHTRVRGIDRNQAMIDHVWPGDMALAQLGTWTETGLASASIDLVLTDGGTLFFAPGGSMRDLVAELARIVVPGGRVAVRIFAPSENGETPDAVIDALLCGTIANMNELKIRLACALTDSVDAGIAPDTVLAFLDSRVPDRDAVFGPLGWNPDEVAMIDHFRGLPGPYHYAGVDRVRGAFCDGQAAPFRWLGAVSADQPIGDQCPHLRFERR